MRSRYKVIQEGIYFITSSVIGWINIFRKNHYREIILNELKYRRDSEQIKLYGYVIMPNHIHLILSSKKLSNLMRSFKSHIARNIVDNLIMEKNKDVLNKIMLLKKKSKMQSDYQLWQEGFHPKLIISEKEFQQKLNYIHDNPVKSELVGESQMWKYSSYSNYFGGDILLEIDML